MASKTQPTYIGGPLGSIKQDANKQLIMKNILLIIWIVIGLTSCNSQTTKQSKQTTEYECNVIGWKFSYPSDWKVLSDDDIAVIEGRGKSAMESTINEEIEVNNKNLLWLKKDQFNSFTSTIQPYDSLVDGPYLENQASLNHLIIETYKNQGIQFDYKICKELIDGLEFTTLE